MYPIHIFSFNSHNIFVCLIFLNFTILSNYISLFIYDINDQKINKQYVDSLIQLQLLYQSLNLLFFRLNDCRNSNNFLNEIYNHISHFCLSYISFEIQL